MVIERATRFAGRKLAKLAGRDPNKLLFRGDDHLFVTAFETCSVYGEYGCGASTIWCANHTKIPIISVDSSAEWIHNVRDGAARSHDLTMHHIDLGELGDWGRPIDYSRRSAFPDYTTALWQHIHKPDLILADGRFRVACFLQTLIQARPGATMLFDDYVERPNYDIVEEFATRQETCGAMAKFTVPQSLDMEAISREIAAFTYVMD